MSRRPSVGDVFEVQLDASSRRFFQYVADDPTQLGSQVVRVFSRTYDAEGSVDIGRVATGEIDFHAHVFLALGLKQRLWRKAGHAEPPAELEILFRNTNDYGRPEIKVSRNWHVWRVGCPFEKVGPLPAALEEAEIGVVVPPDSLVYRIRHGRYDFVYPDY